MLDFIKQYYFNNQFKCLITLSKRSESKLYTDLQLAHQLYVERSSNVVAQRQYNEILSTPGNQSSQRYC